MKSLNEQIAWFVHKWPKFIVFLLIGCVVNLLSHMVHNYDAIIDSNLLSRNFSLSFPLIAFNVIFIMIMDPIVKNDIQILKRKGIIPFLIMAILTMNTPTVRAQSIETVIGDNALEFYPTHVMLPITDPNQGFNGEPQVLNIAVVVVVVVVAIVIIYYLVDFCQRKFPKTPPPEDDPVSALPAGNSSGNSSAMSVTYSSYGSCRMDDLTFSAASEPEPLLVYELSGMVKLGNGIPEFRVSGLKKLPYVDPEDNLQDLAGFKRSLRSWGVDFDDAPTGTPRYGKNGRPSTAEQVPISFDYETKTVTVSSYGETTYGIVIEKTNDLEGGVWKQMLRTRIPMGREIKLVDVTDSNQTFYRIRPL